MGVHGTQYITKIHLELFMSGSQIYFPLLQYLDEVPQPKYRHFHRKKGEEILFLFIYFYNSFFQFIHTTYYTTHIHQNTSAHQHRPTCVYNIRCIEIAKEKERIYSSKISLLAPPTIIWGQDGKDLFIVVTSGNDALLCFKPIYDFGRFETIVAERTEYYIYF